MRIYIIVVFMELTSITPSALMWMIHFPGVNAKGSAKPSPGTVRKDGEGLLGNTTSLLCSDPAEAEMVVMSHTQLGAQKTKDTSCTSLEINVMMEIL